MKLLWKRLPANALSLSRPQARTPQCGEMVLRACVKNHTHYVDISGETNWMHDMLERYHEEAKQKGILLVQAAAQVCAIDDINCYLLAQKAWAVEAVS